MATFGRHFPIRSGVGNGALKRGAMCVPRVDAPGKSGTEIRFAAKPMIRQAVEHELERDGEGAADYGGGC